MATPELIGFGISGFPSVQYYRQTVDSSEVLHGMWPSTDSMVCWCERTAKSMQPGSRSIDCPDGQMCGILVETCK